MSDKKNKELVRSIREIAREVAWEVIDEYLEEYEHKEKLAKDSELNLHE